MNVRHADTGVRHLPGWRDESGKNSIRGIIALALIVGAVYVGVKFLPVRTAAFQFDDAVRDEVVFAGSRRSSDDQIMQSLLESADILGLPIQRGDIRVRRQGRKYIVVDAEYTVVVELIGGYTFNWNFSPHHEGPVF